MRNVRDRLPKPLKYEVADQVRAILHAPDVNTAQTLLHSFLTAYQEKVPRITEFVETALDDVTAVLSLSEPYRRRLRTTNGMKRLNEEFRRRERVIRIFPNQDSVIRLMGAVLMEQDEKWLSGRRYLKMDNYFDWKAKQLQSVKSGKIIAIYSKSSSSSVRQARQHSAARRLFRARSRPETVYQLIRLCPYSILREGLVKHCTSQSHRTL
ncbi:hypothetical protein EWH91_13865 [Sporolactobacillus sp. THM19-2]|nr:hypothetical protein EWH91_13865 [Sporolactobacillus sp. THM19-2]